MSLSMTLFTFVNAWWISLFFALPFGIERSGARSSVEYAAAPTRIRWKKTCVITTILAVLFTLVLALVIKSGIIPVRDL